VPEVGTFSFTAGIGAVSLSDSEPCSVSVARSVATTVADSVALPVSVPVAVTSDVPPPVQDATAEQVISSARRHAVIFLHFIVFSLSVSIAYRA
jgi:hypothetical protein